MPIEASPGDSLARVSEVRGDSEFARALRAAVDARGLTLERLRAHLNQRGHNLSAATLSYWQSGRSRPERAASRAALTSLEEILEVPKGSLTSLLVPRRRGRDGAALPTFDGISSTSIAKVVDQLAAAAGITWQTNVRRFVVHDQVSIGPTRRLQHHVMREVLRAEADGVDRIALWHCLDEGGAQPLPVPVRNCRLGKLVRSEQHNLVVAELLLPYPLANGESVVIEYRMEPIGTTNPLLWWERGTAEELRELHMEIHFHPDAIPTSAARVFTLRGQQERTEPVVIRSSTIELLVLDFGPGAAGLRWTW